MALKHAQEYRDAGIARHLATQIRARSRKPVRMMEVCGTHTVSIFRSGLRSLLPETLTLISGPGCPVCVTDQADIDAFVALARQPGVIATTFGDLMRVPGTESSLQRERAAGRDVRIVYSAFDTLKIARENPDRQVVFFGVGFETTTPTVAATIMAAAEACLENFSVWSAHKTVPPALEALMQMPEVAVDAFLLPGHVSVVIGTEAYRPFFQRHRMPCVVAGFEPADLLAAIAMIVDQVESGAPALANAYPRAVTDGGNPRAREVMDRVFAPVDAPWRGLGVIAGSGLELVPAFDRFNARHRFALELPIPVEPRGCICGRILTGTKRPPECPLFGTRCTPMNPVGPCMVSSEGTCAAYYRYARSGRD
jgi:hydrogenase expression/formation protein HypD